MLRVCPSIGPMGVERHGLDNLGGKAICLGVYRRELHVNLV